MGVYGLTSYVAQHAFDCFIDHKLHDCLVLVDGNSAASLIYSNLTKSNHAFGGDYDKYAQSTSEFVELLARCHVRPVFIFDGGYESRKVKTIIERIKMNIVICGQYKHKYRESRSFPLLLRDVFKLILQELDVPIVQCDFEADHEIVTLAKMLRCPVISSDSDFYISDIRYIPFTSIEFRTVRFNKKSGKRRYYLPCRIFDADTFLRRFGGLENKSTLPLLSCALGNDYVPTNVFKNFLNMDHMTKFDDRLKRIVKWLRTVGSVDKAIDQMTSTLVRHHHNIQNSIKRLTLEFDRTHSPLLSHLPVELTQKANLEENLSKLSLGDLEINPETEDRTFPPLEDSIDQVADDSMSLSFIKHDDELDNTIYCNSEDDGIVELDEEEYELSCPDSEPETNEFSNNFDDSRKPFQNRRSNFIDSSDSTSTERNQYSEAHLDLEIPPWLSEKFRRALISPTVMNILTFQKIFVLSQSEDYFCRPSHELCLPVLQLVAGIILNESTNVQCHARSKSIHIGVYNIVPTIDIPSYGPVPSLRNIPDLDEKQRQRIILEGLDIPKSVDLSRFPEEWRLYVITLVYWKQNCAQCSVNSSHIRTLFVCLIYLSIIDEKIGFARSNNDLKSLRKSSKKQSNDNDAGNNAEQNPPENEDSSDSAEFSFYYKTSYREYLEQIPENDCFQATNTLLQYHRIDENLLKNRKQFNTKTVHAFAQLQHCMQNIMLLNSVLDFPFVQYKPHRLFSGTFVYNFYSELHSRKLADGYITRTLLAKANSLIALYRFLINSWEVCISLKEERPAMKKRKSKKKRNSVKGSETDEVLRSNVVDEGYDDPDNIFSMLPEE